MTEPQTQFVELLDRTLAYREYPGEGPAYLLIHGIGGRATDWSPVIAQMRAHNRRIVVVDLPGHGQSSKEPGDYSLGALASVLRDLLDHLHIDQVILVGHSLGGGIAMQFAYQFPGRYLGLVLVCAGGLGIETPFWLRAASLPGAGFVFAGIGSSKTAKSLTWVRKSLGKIGIDPQTLSAESIDRMQDFSDPDMRRAFLATLRSVIDIRGQRVSAVGKIEVIVDVPTLLIWGAIDPVIPLSHGEAAAELIPNCELVVFPRIGHEPHLEDPSRVTRLLLEFANRVEPVRV